MSDRVNWREKVLQDVLGIPELVEVVYAPSSHSTLIREIARMRCEAEEAEDAIQAFSDMLDLARHEATGIQRRKLAEWLGLVHHVREHIRWIRDPSA